MWHDKFTHLIKSAGKLPSKPFRSTHVEQIKLVKSFEWLDFAALHGIDDEFREILSGSMFIDEVRRDALCTELRGRVKSLEELNQS
jgi:hypothetical protein